MTPTLALAIGLGALLGTGVWLLVSQLPAFARPRLSDRIAPALVDVSEGARDYVQRRRRTSVTALGTLLDPILGGVRRVLSGVLGGGDEVRQRLRRAGSASTVERFRTEQAGWALIGAVGGVLVGLLGMQSNQYAWGSLLVAPLLGLAIGAVARDWLLSRAATARIHRIASEYPTTLEFLSLSLAAGEGLHAAITRVSTIGKGELARELREVVLRVSAGESLSTVLVTVSRELGYPPLERTSDHLMTAIERGSPLVEVLRAQAEDARVLAKRELLEQSGRREIGMMVPLVMIVLPITVLFSVYPSFFVLTTTF